MTQDELLYFLRRVAGDDGVALDTPLFSSGLIDSIAMMQVIGYLEDHGHVRLGTEDVTLDNLDTANRMLALVAARH